MNPFSFEVVTPPTHLPITVADEALVRAVTEEIERLVLWRAIVSQERRITVDGPLPPRIEIEPVSSVVGLTRWTPDDDAVVIDAASYYSVSRDPSGTIIEPVHDWPEPERSIGSFALSYVAGWAVSDTSNSVPASVQLLVEKAVAFRAGARLGDIKIGSLDVALDDAYKTDRLPAAIASIGAAFAYRPGIFAGRP